VVNLWNSVFGRGQWFVAVSGVTSVHNIKGLWDEEALTSKCKNVVYTEVIVD
jgi:hypothetical protein